MWVRATSLALSLLLTPTVGCGSASQVSGERQQSEVQGKTFDFALRRSDQTWLYTADHLGEAVVLVLFATYDIGSIALIERISQSSDIETTLTIGVAVQPNAADLLPAFISATEPSFSITYLGDALPESLQPLSVPTILWLDAKGKARFIDRGIVSDELLKERYAALRDLSSSQR